MWSTGRKVDILTQVPRMDRIYIADFKSMFRGKGEGGEMIS